MSVCTTARADMMASGLYLVLAGAVLLSRWWIGAAYAVPLLLFAQYVLILAVPVRPDRVGRARKRVLPGTLAFVLATVVAFAFVYRFHGLRDVASGAVTHSWGACLAFSAMKWATIGHSGLAPLADLRFLAASEAVLGVLSWPLLGFLAWHWGRKAFGNDRVRQGEPVRSDEGRNDL